MITQELKVSKEPEVENNKIKANKQKSNIMPAQKYEEALSELSAKYPKLFNKQGIKLLKVGIRKEIIVNGNLTISNSQLTKFLKVYCTSNKYKELHVENAKRYDLAGNESGVVTKKQIEGLVKLKEEAKKKRELKKQRRQEWAKKQEEKNNNAKVESKNASKEQENSCHSKTNNDTKVKKSTVTQDNIGNIKSANHTTNSTKPKLGIKL